MAQQINLDRALEDIKPFGRYQKILYLLLCVPTIFTAYITLSTVFTAATPQHRCFVSQCDTESNAKYSDAWDQGFVNFTIPRISDKGDEEDNYSECMVYKTRDYAVNPEQACRAEQFDLKSPMQCDRWLYANNLYHSSVVSEWNLVCQDEWMGPMISSVFFAGVLCAALLFGILADWVGRKLALMLAILIMSVCSIALAFVNNYEAYLALSFMVAFGQAGVFQTAFILAVEAVGKDYRVFCGIIIEYFFVLGELLLALIAWLTRDWREILLIGMAPSAALLLYWPFLPESMRWNISKGKIEEAQKQMDKIAKFNKVDPVKLEDYTEESGLVHMDRYVDWLRSKILMFRSFNLFYAWLVITMCFYGLSLSSASLAGDAYLNFFLTAIVEIPGYSLSYLTMQKIGRKWSTAASLMVGGTSLIIGAFVQEITWLNITCFLIGKLGVTSAFGTVYLYTSELYPTSMRTVGVGASSMFGRVGAIISPFIGQMDKYASWLPMTFFGINALVSGLLCLLLPETLGKRLPDSITDAINFGRENLEVLVENEETEPHQANENDDVERGDVDPENDSQRVVEEDNTHEERESTERSPLLGCL